jgi:hypothetical protein
MAVGTQNNGMDFNFFATVVASNPGPFPLAANTAPDVLMAFRGPRRIMFVGVAGSNVQYSFNGNNVHGRISAGQIFNFDVRNEDKIWFIGTGTVDVHAWHIGA